MQLGIHRHVDPHRAGAGQQQRHFHVIQGIRQQAQQPQAQRRNQQQPDCRNRIQAFPPDQIPDVDLRQINADREHRQRRVQRRHGAQAAADHRRQLNLGEEQEKPDQDRDHERSPDQLLRFKSLSDLLSIHDGHAIGPLSHIQKGNEARHIEHGSLPDGGDHQRHPEKTGIREGSGKGSDHIRFKDHPGNENRQQQQNRRRDPAVQHPRQVLRRPLYPESVDDDRRQRQINQDVAQPLAALQCDFLSFVKQKAQPGQHKHLQNLAHKYQNNVHGLPRSSFVLPRPLKCFFSGGKLLSGRRWQAGFIFSLLEKAVNPGSNIITVFPVCPREREPACAGGREHGTGLILCQPEYIPKKYWVSRCFFLESCRSICYHASCGCRETFHGVRNAGYTYRLNKH